MNNRDVPLVVATLEIGVPEPKAEISGPSGDELTDAITSTLTH